MTFNFRKFSKSAALSFTSLFILAGVAFPATYFISNNGNDANNGTSPGYPWRTINKLNSMMSAFRPGDNILFERGGYFVGQVNINASGSGDEPLTFGAYGEGADPVLSGSLPVRSWNALSGGIYTADVDTAVRNMFCNFRQMIIARYPNSGYLRVKQSLKGSKTGFFDNGLNQPENFWKGATAYVRTNNWTIEYSRVKGFRKGTVLLEQAFNYDIEKDWGYFFDNKLNLLDTLNEWYYEDSGNRSGKLYIKPPSGINPSQAFIEASFISIGFYSGNNLRNVIIRDLNITNQSDYGIYFTGRNRNVKVINCTFQGQVKSGIFMPDMNYSNEILNCRFNNINGEGIYLIESRRCAIKNCIFTNIGMMPGYGTNGTAFGMSALVALKSDSLYISENYISRVGHDGINVIGKGNLIEKNVLKEILLYLNDGGGIKSYGETVSGTVWRNNFVSDVRGNLAGTPSGNRLLSYGLYPDAGCRDMLIENNTVETSSGAGIFLYEGCFNNVIRNNTCFNNSLSIKFRVDKKNSAGNTVSGNLFAGAGNNQFAVRLIAPAQGFVPGVFDRNEYSFPNNELAFQFETPGRLEEFNLADWVTVIKGNEKNSIVLSGEDYSHPRIFRNMSGDTLNYLLDAKSDFMDAGRKKVYGSVQLMPWSSRVLFSSFPDENYSTLEIMSSDYSFGRRQARSVSESRWMVVSAKNISSAVSLKAPDGFEISYEPERNYSKTLSYIPSSRKEDKLIYLRFSPADEKTYYGFIEISSGNSQRLIRVSGSSR